MIYITDDIRISRVDDLNLQVEVLTKGVSKKTKEEIDVWSLAGYYASLKGAILGILKLKLLAIAEDDLRFDQVIEKINYVEKELLYAVNNIKI